MARKSEQASATEKTAVTGQFQFVNYDLTKEDKIELKSLNVQPMDIFATVASLTKEGYKLSISWDAYSDCVQAILIGAGKETRNYGHMLSARAQTVEKCLASLLYKHQHIFEGVWHDRNGDGRPTDDF